MLDIKCRLCSSTCALISLFGGKSRQNRDLIRKLVEVTIGIKFKEDDLFKYICYPCTIQVYNFFIFKNKSEENEKALEAHIKKDEKKKSRKIKILHLDDIVIPDASELQSTLGSWLLSKSDCEDQHAEKVTEQSNTELKKSEGSVKNIDVSIQCRLPEDIFHKSCQSDSSVFSRDQYIQCVVPGVAKSTQTNKVFTNSNECLVKDGQENSLSVVTPQSKATNKVKCCSSCEKDCQERECKCHIGDLASIKLEPKLLPLTNHRNESKTPRKRKIVDLSSPVLTNSVNKVANGNLNCKVNDSYNLCNFCNRKFSNSRQTRRHIENHCEIGKAIKKKPVVQLVRLENLKTVLSQYPQCLNHLKDPKNEPKSDVQCGVRLRSRSTSSVESLYTLCSDSLTMLHDLKLGKDKSTQTSLLFDNGHTFNFLQPKVILKAKPKRGRPVSLAKKLRLSQ